jgi:hypothetical protein
MTPCQVIIPRKPSRLTPEEDLAPKIFMNMKETLKM